MYQEKKQDRQELKRVGLKVTRPRLRILHILERAAEGGMHLSAEDVYRALLEEKTGTDIGIATVYRVLTQFEAAQLVHRHNFEDGRSVFELDRGEHHDHMVCQETGKIIEFCDDEIERLQKEIADRHGYELLDHSLVLYVRPKRS